MARRGETGGGGCRGEGSRAVGGGWRMAAHAGAAAGRAAPKKRRKAARQRDASAALHGHARLLPCMQLPTDHAVSAQTLRCAHRCAQHMGGPSLRNCTVVNSNQVKSSQFKSSQAKSSRALHPPLRAVDRRPLNKELHQDQRAPQRMEQKARRRGHGQVCAGRGVDRGLALAARRTVRALRRAAPKTARRCWPPRAWRPRAAPSCSATTWFPAPGPYHRWRRATCGRAA